MSGTCLKRRKGHSSGGGYEPYGYPTRISENGNKNVTVKAYPNLNHLFQTCEKGTLAEYGQLEETISPEVLKDITDWILKHSGKSN